MLKACIRGVWGVTGRGVYGEGEGEGVVQGQYFLQRILSSGLLPAKFCIWTDLGMRLF